LSIKAGNYVCALFLISVCLFSLFSLDWFRWTGSQSVGRSANIATVGRASSSFASLFEKSSHVIVGNVLSVESRWDEKAATIFTYVKVYVEESLKGNLTEDYVVIKHRGGEVGNIGLLVSDEPHFLVGERVKVFLKKEETGYFSVVSGVDVQSKAPLILPASSSYNYSGIHWASADLPVPYYINEAGTPDVAGTASEFNAVKAGFQTWEDDAGSFMEYTYMGTTARTDQLDGYNVVSWGSIDGTGGTLAVTTSWYNLATLEMIEFDIVFDEAETWSATGELDKFDIQNVGTHEVGHTLALGDLYDDANSEETMYGFCLKGETKKRTLSTGDIEGIRYIYPVSSPTVIITIATNPSALQMEVDGTMYTAPQSFKWATNTTHTINVPSAQSGGTSTRYIFSEWSDGGSQQHTIIAGASDVTITASFGTQHFAVVSIQGLELAFPATLTFAQAGQSGSAFSADSWSDWCDAGTILTISKYVSSEEGKRWLTHGATSWTVDSPFSANVSYVLQYRVTIRFMTNDQAVSLRPTSVQILGSAPNGTLLALTFYTNLWLDNVEWTLKKVLWQNSNVVPVNEPSLSLAPDYQWTIVCQVYPISFEDAFQNFKGEEINEPPSAFTLVFPNDTVSGQLRPSTVYYIQNGTTMWQSIMWQDTEVAPAGFSFDAALGNPTVNCRVYDFSVKVSDALGFPVSGAYVSVEFQNGKTRTLQTGLDGVALIRMVPVGEFTMQVSFLTQNVLVVGDVAEAAFVPVEVEFLWGLSSLALFFIVCALVSIVCAFVALRVLRRRHKTTVNLQESNVQQPF
jgi:hypothetical protein